MGGLTQKETGVIQENKRVKRRYKQTVRRKDL